MANPAQPVLSDHVDEWADVRGSIVINAPYTLVRQITQDVERFQDIYPGMENIQVDEGYPKPGTKMTYQYRAGAIGLDAISISVESTDTRQVSETENRSRYLNVKRVLKGRNIIATEPHEGGSLLTICYEYELPSTVYGKMVEARVTRSLLQRNLNYSLNRIKELAEALHRR